MALVLVSSHVTCAAVGLARVPSAENIDGGEVGSSDILHVLIAGSVWPVLREHRPTVGVLFHLPDRGTETGALES
jgi:hypothetical protein